MNTIEFENGSLIQTINYESENSHDDIINIYSADDKPVRVCYENNWNVTETTQGKDGELLAEIKRYIATPASLNNCKSCNDEIVILITITIFQTKKYMSFFINDVQMQISK